jgi:hypothetical protein
MKKMEKVLKVRDFFNIKTEYKHIKPVKPDTSLIDEELHYISQNKE